MCLQQQFLLGCQLGFQLRAASGGWRMGATCNILRAVAIFHCQLELRLRALIVPYISLGLPCSAASKSCGYKHFMSLKILQAVARLLCQLKLWPS